MWPSDHGQTGMSRHFTSSLVLLAQAILDRFRCQNGEDAMYPPKGDWDISLPTKRPAAHCWMCFKTCASIPICNSHAPFHSGMGFLCAISISALGVTSLCFRRRCRIEAFVVRFSLCRKQKWLRRKWAFCHSLERHFSVGILFLTGGRKN